ncbi:MAG: extracellular solute-binding protein, partial [Thermanaerothrix sp.]|nr:extracellular solute-binding protein [Thermanaerothrix sp.]
MKRNPMTLITILMAVFVVALSACAPATTPTPPAPTATSAVAAPTTPPTAPPQPAQEKITVIFPRHEADIVGAFEARVRDFEKTTGIKVELIQSDWDSVADRVIPEMATGGSAYDVVEFDNGWVAEWCGA